MSYEATSTTPVQTAIGIINDFLMGCLTSSNIEEAYDTFCVEQRAWTTSRLRDDGFKVEEIQKLYDDHENCEDTPIYDAYYGYLNQFCRKVLTAAANAL
jgi:hypothetical protein